MSENNKSARFIKAGSFWGELEDISCPICSSPSNPKLIFRKSNGVGLWKCPGCDVMYASPRFTKESLEKIYENEAFTDLSIYNSWSYHKWRESKDRSYTVSNLKVQLLKRFLSEGERVLDVGCATGLFVLEATKQGFKVEGLDPSRMLIETGRRVLEIPLHHGSLEEFDPEYKFKGVVFWDVLEHVYNPIVLLSRCNYLMEQGGYLFIQVPHYKGISNRMKTFGCRLGLKRSDFKHFGFPHHLYSFNKKSISVLMNRTGYKPIHFESWSHQLKDGAKGVVSNTAIWFFRKTCLSDYIICIAQKDK